VFKVDWMTGEVVEAGSLGKPKKAPRLHRSIEDEGRYTVKKG
jgi:hypothetical protein